MAIETLELAVFTSVVRLESFAGAAEVMPVRFRSSRDRLAGRSSGSGLSSGRRAGCR